MFCEHCIVYCRNDRENLGMKMESKSFCIFFLPWGHFLLHRDVMLVILRAFSDHLLIFIFYSACDLSGISQEFVLCSPGLICSVETRGKNGNSLKFKSVSLEI